ncbi:N-acylneuraminate cytidylyltransferase [Mannheimia granulomatis]|uniref:N-acylneuraminate cytidylyltransferase n=1 Tax=Mannheimia granulomatis TaxID=85402 RepID=A0A011M157_9PAST|nr:SGNH/GDSL hydrolase family protein [Mannheimia granulomatis]EXI63248.1 N-acylneuraminate cytidylyltransferase [Mannheimia granulomatis]RGE49070.1 N-acylneuraminate cytidylyltransferase [Mannheimia granulomatis]
MLTDQDIFNRYQTKEAEFKKRADITLIGHSLFDMWGDMEYGTPNLAGQSVANLGLSGTSTRQYLDVIIKPNRIQHVGKNVFIFLGVNDIVKEPDYSPKQVLDWIEGILAHLKQLSPDSRYFLLEATPVNNIATTDNPAIKEMNAYFEAHCPSELTYVKTWQHFANKEGKLDLSLCHDGLHFTQEGYDRLKATLEAYL